MASQMITLRMENKFLSEIDLTAKKNNYHSRVEFIRAALREKIESEKTNDILEALKKLRGISKTKTTDKDLEKIREEAGKEFEKMTEKERQSLLDAIK